MADEMEKAARIALRAVRLALHQSAIRQSDRRSLEIYLLVTTCGVAQTIAATVCGCTKQNISKLVRAVEERREARDFDSAIAALEAAVMGV